MLSGDNGILQRATDAKVKTEKAQIIEKAQTDILGQQAENKGINITKGQLAKILNTYFKPTAETSIPDEISTTNDLVLTTIDDKYNINLSQIYTGPFEVGQAKWSYNHDTQTVTNGTLTLSIGDYVNDTETTVTGFDGKWRVLGEENGQLLLVTANYIDFEGSQKLNGYPVLALKGSNGIDNEIARLNVLSSKCADGIKTEKGRSITIEDINRITGYTPTESRLNSNDLTQKGLYGQGEIYQYGNNVTYTIKDGYVWYKGDQAITNEKKSGNMKFWKVGEDNNIAEPYTMKSTFYTYNAETLGAFNVSKVPDSQTIDGITANSSAYDMLFKLQTNDYQGYWIASSCCWAYKGEAYWYLFSINQGGWVNSPAGDLWTSRNGASANTKSIRSVVYLNSNISPTFVSKDSTTNISTYKI